MYLSTSGTNTEQAYNNFNNTLRSIENEKSF